MKAKAWKIIILGIITLILGIYIFLTTSFGSDINMVSMFIMLLGFYIMVSTLIKMHNYLRYGIEQ
ncbi:MAG: hypothetical protein KAI57_01055 [Candidatus Pacebacteria bacterium]|nr:hypothetical protein [Candidatus Paceibacterota bacterium]